MTTADLKSAPYLTKDGDAPERALGFESPPAETFGAIKVARFERPKVVRLKPSKGAWSKVVRMLGESPNA